MITIQSLDRALIKIVYPIHVVFPWTLSPRVLLCALQGFHDKTRSPGSL